MYVDTDCWQDWFLTITLTTVVLINICNGIFQVINMILSTFPKVFSQVATSLGYFPKCQLLKGIFLRGKLPKGIFPSDNFPNVQLPKGQLPKCPSIKISKLEHFIDRTVQHRTLCH